MRCRGRKTGDVFLRYVRKIYRRLVVDAGAPCGPRGPTTEMLCWADVFNSHPELLADVVRLKEGGGSITCSNGVTIKHPFDEHCARFAAAGIPFYVCPGTSSWSVSPGTENSITNISEAARAASVRAEASSPTGDCGHLQPLSVWYLAYVAGAQAGWCAGGKTSTQSCFMDSSNSHADIDVHAGVDRRVRPGCCARLLECFKPRRSRASQLPQHSKSMLKMWSWACLFCFQLDCACVFSFVRLESFCYRSATADRHRRRGASAARPPVRIAGRVALTRLSGVQVLRTACVTS